MIVIVRPSLSHRASLYIGKYAYPRGRENVHRNHLGENYKGELGRGREGGYVDIESELWSRRDKVVCI